MANAVPDAELEPMAQALEASGKYRVLRRLDPARPRPGANEVPARTALVLDVETTGLNPEADEVIELAMTPFGYSADGRVLAVKPPFQGFQEPSRPLPPEIEAITGITAEMVAGQVLDLDAVDAMASAADVVIAHNADFDRRFVERICPAFKAKPWACSMTQIDWASEGLESAKLEYLALKSGFFYDRHRALNDCWAVVELLGAPLPRSGVLALNALLAAARRPICRLYAERSPFEAKDLLKARGYRWGADASGAGKAWRIDLDPAAVEAETAFLREMVYRADAPLPIKRITAKERFSERS